MENRRVTVWSRVRRYAVPAAIAALFTVLSGKIAFTSSFPMAFDESYHFGLIKVYTQHLNPFLAGQPAGADALGAVAREGSYLYHYLMSFPVRLAELAGVSQFHQILMLRGLSILFGLASLYVMYRIGRSFRLPSAVCYIAVLAFAVTPVCNDLFSQVNYDALVIPLGLSSVLITMTAVRDLRLGRVNLLAIGGSVALILTASLVKYAYLPIGLVLGTYLLVQLIRYAGLRRLGQRLAGSWRGLGVSWKIVLIVGLVGSSLLWGQRYGVNMAAYHTPHPQCQVVLSVKDCSQYGVWLRNWNLHATRDQRPMHTLLIGMFGKLWLRLSYENMFSTTHIVPNNLVFESNTVLKRVYLPLFIAGTGLGLYALIVLKRIRHYWVLPILVSAGYVSVLFGQNFSDFHNLHALVGVQGRYLLPVLPLLYIFMAAGFYYVQALLPSRLFVRRRRQAAQPLTAMQFIES